MKAMKFKKVEENVLDYQEIIIVEIVTWRKRTLDSPGSEWKSSKTVVNDFQYLAIADGIMVPIFEDDWMECMGCYEFVEFVN